MQEGLLSNESEAAAKSQRANEQSHQSNLFRQFDSINLTIRNLRGAKQ